MRPTLYLVIRPALSEILLFTYLFGLSAGVLLYILRQGYTSADQSRAAFILRRDIRKAHVDVRFNSRVAADCWCLINAIENGEVDLEPTAPMTTTNGKRKSLDSSRSRRRQVRKEARKRRPDRSNGYIRISHQRHVIYFFSYRYLPPKV